MACLKYVCWKISKLVSTHRFGKHTPLAPFTNGLFKRRGLPKVENTVDGDPRIQRFLFEVFQPYKGGPPVARFLLDRVMGSL